MYRVEVLVNNILKRCYIKEPFDLYINDSFTSFPENTATKLIEIVRKIIIDGGEGTKTFEVENIEYTVRVRKSFKSHMEFSL